MTDCDFIPQHYHEKYSLSRAIQVRISCIAAMAVLMIVWVVAHQRDISTANAILVEIVHQKEQLMAHASKKAVMEEEKSRLSEYQNLIEQLSDKGSLVVVFSSLSRQIPDSVVLTRMTMNCPSVYVFAKNEKTLLEEKSPAASAAQPVNQALKTMTEMSPVTPFLFMEGMALTSQDVIQFAADLESSPLFGRVHVETKGTVSWAGHQGQAFELLCELAPQEKKLR